MATLTFYGAAHTVTGSCHLLEADGKRIMLDCGLFQGRREESAIKNQSFPFDPKDIDVLAIPAGPHAARDRQDTRRTGACADGR